MLRRGMMAGASAALTYLPALQLDASDLSTLFQDSAGSTPVTADGDRVGKWMDKSGNGKHFYQATSGSRPTYRTSGGYHWIEFAVGQWMYGTAGDLSFSSVSAVFGYRPISGTSDYANIIGVPHAGTHTAPYYRWNLCIRTSGGFEYGYTANGNQYLNNDFNAGAVGNDVIASFGPSGMWRADQSAMWYPMTRMNKALGSAQAAGTSTISYPNSTAPTIGASAGGGSDQAAMRLYCALVGNGNMTTQAHIDEWEAWVDARVP